METVPEGQMKSDIEANLTNDATINQNDSNPDIIILSAPTELPVTNTQPTRSTTRPPVYDTNQERNPDSSSYELNTESSSTDHQSIQIFISLFLLYLHF